MVAGLTGGIGSGKSTVAKLFGLLGWKLFNSDAVAKQLYFDSAIKEKVKLLLGENAYLSENTLNTEQISALIFNNAQLLKNLNAILHPAVGEKFKLFCLAHPSSPIIKESALLFEAGIAQQMDKIILVVAPDEIRIQRVMQRDKITRELILKKLNQQMLQSEKIKKADIVIVNDGQQSLIEQVLKAHKILTLSSTT